MNTIIKGFTMYYFINGDTMYYYFSGTPTRYSTIKYYKWVLGLHGNAPTGTPYGSYRITLPNKKRITVKAYL